jgi:RecB family exonuclease
LPDESSPKALVGSAIHEVFELLSDPKKQERRKKYIFHSVLTSELHPSIDKLFSKFMVKYKIPQLDKKELDLHEMGRDLMLSTFQMGYQPHTKVLAVEKLFEIPVTDKVWIKGYIDRVCELDKDTIELTDYKSGQPFNQEKCEAEFQPFF